MVEDWSLITLMALQDSWQIFLGFVPKIIGAVFIFVIGWLIAIGIAKLIAEILTRIGFDKLFEKSDWKEAFEKADLNVNPSDFIGAICKWILVIVFLLASVEILGLIQFTFFLKGIITWLPNLIVAVAIFVVAVVVADILEKILKASIKKIGVRYASFLGMAIKISIYVFAGLAILLQLGIAKSIINTLVMGIVGMISLAVGLSFGLGGKETAARILEDIREKISDR